MIIVGMNGEITDVPEEGAAKSLPEAVSKSLSENNEPPKPINPFKPDPFREPINKLDQVWPLVPKGALEGGLDKGLDKEKEPERENPPVPVDLPGATPVVPPVVPPAPVPTMISSIPQPIFTPPPRPILQNRVETPAPPPPPEPPKPEPFKTGLQNIRTYESDVANILAQKSSSRASMAIAENVKRGEGQTLGNAAGSEERSHLGSKLLLILVSLVLIGAGMIGGYYLYAKSPLGAKPPAVTTPRTPPALVPYENRAVINVDGLNREGVLKRFLSEISKPQAPGSIKEIVATETKEGLFYRVPAAEMAYIMQVPVPDIILRTLNLEWMLGIYASQDGSSKSAFVVVTTDLFQNAFAGMLAWERGLPEDVRDFLPVSSGTITAELTKGGFRDQIVRNKDVRAFVTDNEDTLFVYSFVDNATLVVAADGETLGAVIDRLESKAFVR